jgi:hypothetical protein
MNRPPSDDPRAAFLAVALLCVVCLVIGFALGRTI